MVTEPGAGPQASHADGPPLFPSAAGAASSAGGGSSAATAALPCHCLTLFLPLVDVDATNGATTFFPGTHHTALAGAALAAEARGISGPTHHRRGGSRGRAP